ncbi:MAG TPA: NAD(P)-dependent oxidoreductase [Salinarimonas sp.]|nr:NAD(P)-dependent oxidoreductase [Salinarimonas sp.]
MTSDERIGFIGLGLMGHGMAKNIREAGYPLTVLGHRNRAPVEDMLGRGAVEARTAREVAERSSIVFLCVTASPQVEALVRGPDGLAAGMAPGGIIVDASTSDPTSTLALAAELAPKGITFVDAPLSRTPKEAWAGTLDTMVGCDETTFARLKPVLDTWAGRAIHIGRTGDGHKMKLINNFIAMGYAGLYAEALTLAAKSGLTPRQFDSVIRGGRMECGFYGTFMTYVLERDRDAHKFTLVNALKDTRYIEAMADAAGIANPIGNAVKNYFAIAVGTGRGDDYVPMISDVVAGLAGTRLDGG